MWGGGNHREHSLKAQQIHNGLYNIGELSNAATRAHTYAYLCLADCSMSVLDSERTGSTQQSETHPSATTTAVATAITTHILTY